jgi:hypothetical protein
MTFQSSADLATHNGFRERVRVAMVTAALNVAAETPSGNATLDAKRAILATRVLGPDQVAFLDSFSWVVGANVSISITGLDTVDGDIQFAVNSGWNAVAGVTA